MKRMTAKEILSASFRELAAQKSIDKITVSEIVKNCGYSSATFYRYFSDKYDMIAWDYANEAEKIMSKVGVSFTWEQMILESLSYLMGEREYLSNLLIHTTGHDSFIKYMTQINYSELEKYVKRVCSVEKLDKETQLYLHFYCVATACLNCEWILGELDVSSDELAVIYENGIPQPLAKYLK